MLTGEELAIVALSLKVAVASVVASLPVAIAVAWLLARRDFPGKTALDALVHLPLVLPPVVVGYLLLLGLGRNGAIGGFLESIGIVFAFRWTGAALAAAVMSFPLVVRAVRLSMEAIDPRLEAAGRTLGAGPWRVFATLTLPLAWPGIVTGALLGFARSLGEFGATITFVASIPGETETLPLAIYAYTQVPGAEAHALHLSILSVLISLGALAVSEWLVRRRAAPSLDA
jgi:molybdate transport system permease protein